MIELPGFTDYGVNHKTRLEANQFFKACYEALNLEGFVEIENGNAFVVTQQINDRIQTLRAKLKLPERAVPGESAKFSDWLREHIGDIRSAIEDVSLQRDFFEALEEWESETFEADTESDFEELTGLVGKTIVDISIDTEELDRAVFVLDGSDPECCELYGECCSQSWFSEIINAPLIIGHKITAVVQIPLKIEEKYNVNDGRTKQDEDSVYGFKIKTDGGSAVFVFRNSSNGYYGGSASLHDRTAKALLSSRFESLKDTEFWMAD